MLEVMKLERGEDLSVVCLDMFGWELDMRFSKRLSYDIPFTYRRRLNEL